MDFYVDKIIEVDYEDLINCIFPVSELFGLKVYKNSIKYEFLIKFSKNPYSKVICFGSGAKQKNHNPPFFHRFSWNSFFKETVIYYNDPTLYLNDNLRLGWCVGERSDWYLESIREILELIFKMKNINFKNVLFYGSSGGGFTSILLATMFKTSCLVNNAQFNLKLYNSYYFESMVDTCFGKISDEELENYEFRINAGALFKKENYIPKINYLVNINSYFDIKNQFLPFIQSISEMNVPLTTKLNIIIYGDENGHNPISKEYTIKYIKKTLDDMDSDKHIIKGDFPNVFKKFCIARLDLKNIGCENNNLVVSSISDEDAVIIMPSWMANDKGIGTQIESSKGVLDIELKCINDGKFKITLRSKNVYDRNKVRLPIFIDYKNFIVNSEIVFENHGVISHDTPHVFEKNVKHGEIIKIHIEWEPFNDTSYF